MPAGSLSPASHFQGIPTHDSLAYRAFLTETESNLALDHRHTLVLRYGRAVRRYVGGWFKNTEDADDVAQRIHVCLLSGECGPWNPDQGQFREFLIRIVKSIGWKYTTEKSKLRPLVGDVTDTRATIYDPDDEFFRSEYRQTNIEIAWSRLETNYELYFTVLRLRVDNPTDDMASLAVKLSTLIGKAFSTANYRKKLELARRKFARYICAAIRDILSTSTQNTIEVALIDLELFDYVKGRLKPKDWNAILAGKE